MVGYSLFGGPDIRDCLSSREADTFDKFDQVADSDLLGENSEDLIQDWIEKAQLKEPVLEADSIHVSDSGRKLIDLRSKPNRSVGDPPFAEGQFIKIAFKISGNASLLAYKPVTFGFVHPDAGVFDQTVELYIEEVPALNPNVLRKERDEFTKKLEVAVKSIANTVSAFNVEIEKKLRARFISKQSQALARQQAIESLGIPIKKSQSVHFVEVKQEQFQSEFEFDIFICHASEDKTFVVEKLANDLRDAGLKVWYDAFVLTIGDSLRQKIDNGLLKSRYGLVVLSPAFFKKRWTQRELDGLTEKEMRNGKKVILPIWHKVNHDDVYKFSPPLADKVAGNSDDTDLVKNILAAVVEEISF